MRSVFPQKNLVSSILLVVIAGFSGGAVFTTAITGTTGADTIKDCVMGGSAGAVIYFTLWSLSSIIMASRFDSGWKELCKKLGVWFFIALLPLALYFPYLLHRSGEGDSVELPPLDSKSSAILLLIWSALFLVILVRINISDYFTKRQSRLLTLIRERPALILTALMAVWLAVFFPLDVLKDQYMHVTTINSTLFKQALLNVFDERGFMFSSILLLNGGPEFAGHFNAIMLLVWPLFRPFPDYRWLLFISDVALVLSAWPVYKISRRRFSVEISLLLAAMFILHPIIASQPGRSDFSELRFMPVIFLTAFYLFDTRRFWSFTGVSLLLISIREDMALFVAMFAIYALLTKRSPKWILVPGAMGATFFMFITSYLVPHFSPTGTAIRVTTRYSNLGSSGGEVIKTLLFKPWKLLQAMAATPSHLGVIYGLWLSFGMGLPLLSAAFILAFPAIAELLLQDTTTFVNFMAIATVSTLFIALILGARRFVELVQTRWHTDKNKTALIVIIIVFFIGLSNFHTWFNPNLYKPRYNYDSAKVAMSMIPDDAKVMLPEFMLIYATRGQELSAFHQITYQLDINDDFEVAADYIIIEGRIPDDTGDDRYFRAVREMTVYLEDSGEFNKVYSSNDINLYIREGHEPVNSETVT